MSQVPRCHVIKYPDLRLTVQSAVFHCIDWTTGKMILRFMCTCILAIMLADLAFGAKPSAVSVTLEKGESATSDDIYIGQSLIVVMTIKFPGGTTTGVTIELLPSTIDTIFAMGEIYNHTVGSALTSFGNNNWYNDVILHPGPEYNDTEAPVYYNSRAAFDLGDVGNDGADNNEVESYITITYQIVYVSIGSNSEDTEVWISCGAAYNSNNNIWISQFSLILKSLHPTFSGPTDFTVNSISEIEAGGKEVAVELTMKIGKAKTDAKVEALVLTESTDVVPMKISMISAAEGFAYSFRTDKFLAKQYEDCSYRDTNQQSLELDMGTIVNKESQRPGAVDTDDEIKMNVSFMVTNASAIGNTYTLGIGVDLDGSEISVANFNVTVISRDPTPTAFSSYTLAAEGSSTIDAGGVGVALATLTIPAGTFHTYVMTMSTNIKSGSTSMLSILSYSIGSKGDNIPCDFDDSVQLYTTNTVTSYTSVMNEANITFSILNTGFLTGNDYTIKIAVMSLPTAIKNDVYELNMDINGVTRVLEFTIGDPVTYDENVAYTFSSSLPQGSRVFTGARFQMDMEVDTDRDKTPGNMTIEIPIPDDIPYVTMIEAKTKLKGANVICPPSGTLEATTSSWNDTLNDKKRVVIILPLVCNAQSVDDPIEDKWVITFDLQIDHSDLYNGIDNVTWGLGVKFSGNQIFVGAIGLDIIAPDNFGSVKLVTGVTITDDITQTWPGDYVLQWSPDQMTFYDHKIELVTQEVVPQPKLALKKPIVTQHLRLTTPLVAGSPAINYTVDQLDLGDNLTFLGDTSAVVSMMPQFMFALDGDVETCMDLPIKNATDTPPYLIGQIATKLLLEDGFRSNKDVASDFLVDLIGDKISCNTSKGPQRTLVWHPKEEITTAFHGNLTKCPMESETNNYSGLKTKCTYKCVCNSVSTCEFILMALIHDDYPNGPYNLCEMRLTVI